MSALDRIGVRVETAPAPVGIGGGIGALLGEIAGMLDRVAAGGDPGHIDLRSLPMTADDRRALREILGKGEVAATVDADGLSNIEETGIDGVWWSEYRDAQGELLAELIEVCRVPYILSPDLDQLAEGAMRLRAKVAARVAVRP